MPWLLAPLYDWFMGEFEEACGREWRADLLAPLRGAVLEIGAGTGRNLEHYRGLEHLVLAEPDSNMRRQLERRAASATGVAASRSVVSWAAEDLRAPDASFDAVVSTLVLCSVTDVQRALAEIRRVLRPGGKLVFLEHVLSDVPSRRVWQRRLEPVWKRVAGNCHLCRNTAQELRSAGFEIERLVSASARKAMPIVRATVRGVAAR